MITIDGVTYPTTKMHRWWDNNIPYYDVDDDESMQSMYLAFNSTFQSEFMFMNQDAIDTIWQALRD